MNDVTQDQWQSLTAEEAGMVTGGNSETLAAFGRAVGYAAHFMWNEWTTLQPAGSFDWATCK